VSKKGRAVSASNAFAELLAQAGLRERQTHESRGIGRNAKRLPAALSFHSLRHTAVTLLKEAGIPQAVTLGLKESPKSRILIGKSVRTQVAFGHQAEAHRKQDVAVLNERSQKVFRLCSKRGNVSLPLFNEQVSYCRPLTNAGFAALPLRKTLACKRSTNPWGWSSAYVCPFGSSGIRTRSRKKINVSVPALRP
jgi:hypothetical protein